MNSGEGSQVGSSSIDLEMMRSELQYLDRVLGPIADERERTQGRVAVDAADQLSCNPPRRREFPRATALKTVAAAGGGGFAAAVFSGPVVGRPQARHQFGGGPLPRAGTDRRRCFAATPPQDVAPTAPESRPVATAVHGARHPQWLDSTVHAVDSLAARLFLRKSGESLRCCWCPARSRERVKPRSPCSWRAAGPHRGTHLAGRFRPAATGDPSDLRMPRGPGVGECLRKQSRPRPGRDPTESRESLRRHRREPALRRARDRWPTA